VAALVVATLCVPSEGTPARPWEQYLYAPATREASRNSLGLPFSGRSDASGPQPAAGSKAGRHRVGASTRRRPLCKELLVDEPVIVDRDSNVLVITINRPSARNAFNGPVGAGVAAAVEELENDPQLRVGILTGAGGNFSSGMDLKAFLAGEPPSFEGRGLCGMTTHPPAKPMIAAVEGWALAGGFEVMLACDLVVAAEDARFGVPEVKRSLVAGAGAALHLTSRVPRAVGLEMLLTGEPISASRAFQVGLVNQVVEHGMALTAALQLAHVIASNGPLAVQATKEIALGGDTWELPERTVRQSQIVRSVIASADSREGALAFAEKRAPVWQGR
jgi:enoyl-CoA hydratase